MTGTSIAFAGQAAYAELLHEVLGEEGIYVGQLIIGGAIVEGDEEKDPAVLADRIFACTASGTPSATRCRRTDPALQFGRAPGRLFTGGPKFHPSGQVRPGARPNCGLRHVRGLAHQQLGVPVLGRPRWRSAWPAGR